MSLRPRVLTNFHLFRTDTGRFSSGVDTTDPDKSNVRGKQMQVQNIPKGLRDIFVADPGMAMVYCDWSAAQWCICMWYAAQVDVPRGFHRNLLDRFQSGDLASPHVFLASKFAGVPESQVTPEQKAKAKGYTFGRMFLGGPDTLAREAGHSIKLGREICRVHDEAFKLDAWQQQILAQCRREKSITTAGGWRVWFWELDPKPNEVLADLIQGTEADMFKWVMAQRVFPTLPSGWEVLVPLHDGVLIHGPEGEAQAALRWLEGCMQTPIPFLDGLTFKVESKVGRNWREVS